MLNRLKFIAVLLFAVVLCVGLSGNRGRANNAAAEAQEKTAEQVYKNIQVFKGLPASQLLGAMNFMAGSLGVSCNHCHVPNQFAKDDKPAKQTARQMIQMMRSINDANFERKATVNCTTCHRGEMRPNSALTIAQSSFPSAAAITNSPAGPLPTVDQILDKYIQAIGGAKKIEKLQTLTMTGTREMRNGGDPPAIEQMEIFRKAPDKLLMNFTASGGGSIGGSASSQAFDGAQGWRRFNGRVSAMGAADLLGAKRDANFYKDFNFKEQYPTLAVIGKETVAGREAFVVEAAFAESHPARTMFGVRTEKLYFDAQSGLLLRRSMEYRTPLGGLPEATDYTDYRKIKGLMFPFTIRLTRPPLVVTQKFSAIKTNAPVADVMFAMPAAK